MELPLYQAPKPRAIAQGVWQRTLDFLKGAGTVILVISVVLWALSSYPGQTIGSSYLAMLGQRLAPLGALMGLEWPMIVALLTSFLRKENTIPTLAVLYGVGQAQVSLASSLSGKLLPAAALAFLAVQMLFIPCVATVAAIKHETKSWGWTALCISLLLAVSLVAGVVIYQAGRWMGWGG
jgi:ferrous iron transport protein B